MGRENKLTEERRGFVIEVKKQDEGEVAKVSYYSGWGYGLIWSCETSGTLEEIIPYLLTSIELDHDSRIKNNLPIEVDVYFAKKGERESLAIRSLLKLYARSERGPIKFAYHNGKKWSLIELKWKKKL